MSPCVRRKLQFSTFNNIPILNFLVELVREKIVCVSRCLERLAGRIHLKFGMVMKNRNIRTITEPDFRFSIWFSRKSGKSAKIWRKKGFFGIYSKTALTILMKFWYVVALMITRLLKKNACPGKIWFGRYGVRKVSEKYLLFLAIFRHDFFI